MNILLEVYACEPNKGSEPEVGWQIVNHIAKSLPNDKIFAITKANNKEAIEKVGYPDNVTFFYYEPPKWLTFWKKGERGVRTYYYLWLIGALFFLKKQKIKFDILHHVTFVNDWLPSYLFLLKNKENVFIWGPIGSHDPISFKFLPDIKRKIIEFIRIGFQKFFRNFDPAFYLCKKYVDCIIGINENVKKKLKLKRQLFYAEPAIALDESEILEEKKNYKENEFIIISVGRLVYIKNFKLSILAFYKFLQKNKNKNIKLQIIGKGPDKEMLQKFVKELGIENHVEFLGKIPRQEVQKKLKEADVFLFPTLENAGFVILEAMANYLPVIALDYGGPKQFITNYKENQLVSIEGSLEDIADRLAERLDLFYRNDDLKKEVGKINRDNVLENFTWKAKAEKFIKIYKELI